MEIGRAEVQNYPQLPREFEASLDYMRCCVKTATERKEKYSHNIHKIEQVENLELRISQVWWSWLGTPDTQKLKAGGLQIQDPTGLHTEDNTKYV